MCKLSSTVEGEKLFPSEDLRIWLTNKNIPYCRQTQRITVADHKGSLAFINITLIQYRVCSDEQQTYTIEELGAKTA